MIVVGAKLTMSPFVEIRCFEAKTLFSLRHLCETKESLHLVASGIRQKF